MIVPFVWLAGIRVELPLYQWCRLGSFVRIGAIDRILSASHLLQAPPLWDADGSHSLDLLETVRGWRE